MYMCISANKSKKVVVETFRNYNYSIYLYDQLLTARPDFVSVDVTSRVDIDSATSFLYQAR